MEGESSDESYQVIESVVLQNQINSLFCEMEMPAGANSWVMVLWAPIYEHPTGLSRRESMSAPR